MKRVMTTAALVLNIVCLCFASTPRAESSETAGLVAVHGSAAASSAQQSSAQQGQAAVIPVQLSKSLDSKKLKAGDPVEAKITVELRAADGTVIPRGSRVTGHVTEASSRAKGDAQSSLGIVFDRIVLKDGKNLPLAASIQAVGAPPSFSPAAPMGSSAPMPGGAGAPSPRAGVGNTGGMGAPASNFPGSSSGGAQQPPASSTSTQQSSGELPIDASGVVGIHDLQLGPNSTLTSDGKQVKLDSGSQINLRVQNQ
jgi:hypothetical protein